MSTKSRSAALSTLAFLTVLVMGLRPALAATDAWPQHRGPHQTGQVSGDGVFDRPELGLAVAWKKPLGSGYSGISVVGELAVTMTSDGADDLVVALDATTGGERWRYRLAERYVGHDGSDDGPISTPLLVDGAAFALGPRGQLVALRLSDGAELWKRTLDGEKESRAPHYGYSTSPLAVGDHVVVLTGGPEGRSVTAFRRADGAVAWSYGDDTVSYETPLLTEIAGRRQLVVSSDHLLLGLDPATGEKLWEHRHTAENGSGYHQPVELGHGRFLLSFFEQTVAFQVELRDGAYAVKELWRSNELRSSYGIPVFHDGYFYGWSGRFIGCFDPATGAAIWRSRPPGGLNHSIVDGHLVIVGSDGALVVARATPAGYEERARLPLFERQSWTAASFASNRLFLRDLREIAAIDVTSTRAAAAAEAPLDLPAGFAAFVARVERADAADRASLVDAYLAAHPVQPVVEDDGHVVFLYRGEAKDVALSGNAAGFGEEVPMRRLAGTDLYFASRRLRPGGHFEYRFNVDFGTLVADPRNPHPIATFGGQASELRMPGWKAPDHVAEPTGPRGRVDTFSFHSALRGNDRDVRVYLPAGYDGGDARYPLLVFNNGNVAIDQEQIDRTLDNLIGKSVRPLIVAFLPRVGSEYGGDVASYAQVTVEELLPELEKRYRLEPGPASRGLAGVGSGAFASAFTAFAAPGKFGKLALQSFYHARDTDLLARIGAGPKQDLVVYVEQASDDYAFQPSGPFAGKESEALVEALRAGGYAPVVNAVIGAPSAGHWRAQNDEILELFFPLAP